MHKFLQAVETSENSDEILKNLGLGDLTEADGGLDVDRVTVDELENLDPSKWSELMKNYINNGEISESLPTEPVTPETPNTNPTTAPETTETTPNTSETTPIEPTASTEPTENIAEQTAQHKAQEILHNQPKHTQHLSLIHISEPTRPY